jgi:negative regulator of flagellin synthesis FlgM
MPDPIQGLNPTGPVELGQTGQAGTSTGTASATPPAGSPSIDSADVARAEALLATIAKTAADVPAIDQQRVAELQQAIQSGTYQVDPQQVALKILQLEGLLAPAGGDK